LGVGSDPTQRETYGSLGVLAAVTKFRERGDIAEAALLESKLLDPGAEFAGTFGLLIFEGFAELRRRSPPLFVVTRRARAHK
jgi:hypothetical protein